MKRCKICGNDTFVAKQDVQVNAIVDSAGNVVDYQYLNHRLDVNRSEDHVGPYFCTRCNYRYSSLDVLEDSEEYIYRDDDLIIEIIQTFHPKNRDPREIWVRYRVYIERVFVTERVTYINPFELESTLHPENCKNAFEEMFKEYTAYRHNEGLATKLDHSNMIMKLLVRRILNDYDMPVTHIDKCSKIAQLCADKLISNPYDICSLTKGELSQNDIYQKNIIQFDDLCEEKGLYHIFNIRYLPWKEKLKDFDKDKVIIQCDPLLLTMIEFNSTGGHKYGEL